MSLSYVTTDVSRPVAGTPTRHLRGLRAGAPYRGSGTVEIYRAATAAPRCAEISYGGAVVGRVPAVLKC